MDNSVSFFNVILIDIRDDQNKIQNQLYFHRI